MAAENTSGQNLEGLDTNTRLTSLETSLSSIEDTLKKLLAAQDNSKNRENADSDHSQSAASAGMSMTKQGGQVAFGQAPSFLKVSTSTLPALTTTEQTSKTAPMQGFTIPTLPPVDFPLQNLTDVASSACGIQPQQWLAQRSLPAISVMGGLTPVPGYLVSIIEKNEFVDLALLRLKNIKDFPTLMQYSLQLEHQLKSKLEPICVFADWAEAWGFLCRWLLRISQISSPCSSLTF